MPLCKLENGTRLHGYMINSCGLHMHGSEAGRASGPLTHLNRHHCARHASPSTVLLLWLPVVNLLISSQPWCYLHCQQRRPGWIPTYSLKHLHYSTFFCFFFFFFFLLFFSFLALPPPTQFYWDITEIKHCISSHYTMWWFHTHIYCEVITTIINTSITSHRYHMCVCVHVPVWWGHLRSSLLATIMQYREL